MQSWFLLELKMIMFVKFYQCDSVKGVSVDPLHYLLAYSILFNKKMQVRMLMRKWFAMHLMLCRLGYLMQLLICLFCFGLNANVDTRC